MSTSPADMMAAVTASMRSRTRRNLSEWVALVQALGDDVSVEGRGGYTPFVRRRQFAAVAAATRTRVDLGLRFPTAPESPLLTASTGPGQSTHKVGLSSPEEVTAEVEELLAAAYAQNG